MTILKPLESRPRLVISLAVGFASYFVAKKLLPPSVPLVVGFDVGVACFLLLTWGMIRVSTLKHLRSRAAQEDVGRWAVLALLVGAACASLFSIAKLLSKSAMGTPQLEVLHVSLSIATILLSWSLIHTLYALTYAHVYYGPSSKKTNSEEAAASLQVRGGLDFPGDDEPNYTDFLYFSLVMGMTCQTSDVEITSTYMRKVTLVHAVLSFFFNTTIVAITISLLASLLN